MGVLHVPRERHVRHCLSHELREGHKQYVYHVQRAPHDLCEPRERHEQHALRELHVQHEPR